MFKTLDLLILDTAMCNAVLMKDDITNNPDELGIIAEKVKYCDQSKILETDAIITGGNDKYHGLVITKRPNDYGKFSYGNKSIYNIPAPAFL